MYEQSPLRILVVDDEAQFCRACRDKLGKIHHVRTATLAKEARRLVASTEQPFDVFIIDQRLDDPEIDGIELMTELLERSPESAAIVLTAWAKQADAVRALKAGADTYVPKRDWLAVFEELQHRLDGFAERQRLRRQRSALLESQTGILRALIGIDSESALEDALQAVVRQANSFLPRVDTITLYYVDKRTNDLRLGGAEGLWYPELVAHRPPAAKSAVRRALQLDEPLFAEDAVLDHAVKGEFVERERIRSTAIFPLMYGESDERVGCMFFSYRTPQRFDSSTRLELETFASHAQLAIHKAVLYDEARRTRERFQTVARITPIINKNLDPDQVIREVLTQIREQIPRAHNCAMLYYDRASGELKFPDVSLEFYRVDNPLPLNGNRVPANIPSIAQQVAQSGQATIVEDVLEQPAYLGLVRATQSQLAVPIGRGDDVLGVLVLESDAKGAFSTDDQLLLEALADQIVVALQKAQQHEQLKQMREDADVDSQLGIVTVIASNWTHSIQQSATVIGSHVHLIEKSLKENPDQVPQWVEEIKKELAEIAKMRETMSRLRYVSTGEGAYSLSDRPAEIDPFIRDYLLDEGKHRPEMEIEFNGDCLGLYVNMAAEVLKIPVGILVHNALKAMANWGRLSVRTRRVGRQVQVTIQDTGPGVRPEVREMLFRGPVMRSEKERGTGIGLMITRKALRLHGGDIWLVEHPSHPGATFEFRLPIVDAPSLKG